jgi:6-phospho-3-hexuloisomerase
VGELNYHSFMSSSLEKVIAEISGAIQKTQLVGYADFLAIIENSGSKIVCTGAGRVGLAMRGFTMRLNHLGIDAHFLGETIVPHTGPGDLLIVGSGSGSTASILKLVEIAKSKGLKIALVTSTNTSPMRDLSDASVLLHTPNKTSQSSELVSIQPMTTLFEQSLSIFLDSVVLDLMEKFGETSASMWARHNVIE